MLNYINQLKNELEIVKNKISIEENKLKKVDLNLRLSELEYTINYCFDLVLKNFPNENIFEFAKEYIALETLTKADQEASSYNKEKHESSIIQYNTQIQDYLNRINKILSANPNAEDESYKGSSEYEKIKNYRINILNIEKYIESTNEKKKNFFNFLSFEEKQILVKEMLEKLTNGIEDEEQLLQKANNYISPLNLLNNATYPLAERMEELTKNKDSSLAKYLLANEEHIKRLTVISNGDVVSNFFLHKVTKLENEFMEKRYEEFGVIAKEKGIENLVYSYGQFNNKIYISNENYDLFLGCINEMQTSLDTKTKIKKLLKKLDELDVIDEHADAGESQNKEYGFFKFIYAREAFITALNEKPENEQKIKEALENLKNEESKIYAMYELIKEELGDDYETMPSNVDSFRNRIVPPCFKTNLALNAKFNSLFIMLTFIKEKNLHIDEFVDNPLYLSNRCIDESLERCNIDNLLSDKTKAEGLLFLAEKNNIPKFEDIVKFTRSLELIYKSERNEEYEKNNHLSFIAVSTLYGNKGRVATIGSMYFEGKTLETIQNIFLAKRNDFGRISYLDSYVSTLPIQDDLKTSVFLEQKPTIVEKIKADENIEETFYEAINVLKEFTVKSKEIKKQNLLLEPKKVFDSVQELAVKIILTLDIKGTSVDQKRGYSERFVRDLYNVIVDYKEVEELKNLKFEPNMKRLNSMTTVIENKDKLVKTLEKNMNLHQKNREDVFIREFERINKEIDLLDKRADELGKKLAKGATNEAIEEIALEQHKKFLELQNLQNKRLKELKEDVENGMITEFYFNKRTEQVKLLSDIKNKPAMFMCDDKNYKNFKTYVKEVLKKDIKSFDQNQLRFNENKYDLLMRKSKDEKQLHLINKILTHYKLSTNKSINYERVEQIVVKDNTSEMKKISEELLESNRQIEEAKKNPQKAPLEVNLEEPNEEVSEEIIKEEVKVVVVKKDS